MNTNSPLPPSNSGSVIKTALQMTGQYELQQPGRVVGGSKKSPAASSTGHPFGAKGLDLGKAAPDLSLERD